MMAAWVAVFLAAATPWLEVLLVVPAGILAGLPTVPVILVAAAGNIATLLPLVYAGDRVRSWWRRRRPDRPAADPSRRAGRAGSVLRRYGLPGLAVLGPLLTGVHVAAVAALATGSPRRATAVWLSGGVVVWAVLAGGLAALGAEVLFSPDALPELDLGAPGGT